MLILRCIIRCLRLLKVILRARPSQDQQLQSRLLTAGMHTEKYDIIHSTKISDYGFRCYSEYEEDGILLYLLSKVGRKEKNVVEMCSGPGYECMAANLIINHGFKGYLFDGSKINVFLAKVFFKAFKECKLVRPEITHAWITRDNVNDLLQRSGATGEIDVFSLDMDGCDYWIWEAIEIISPRICVFETNDIVPSDLELTIPYNPNFEFSRQGHGLKDFRSVSLKAMVNLSRRKGYTMVGANRHGFNIFFVRDDLLDHIPHRPSINDIHNNEWTKHGQKERWPKVSEAPWEDVT